MDLDSAREFVATNNHAVLATTRRDGRPQLSPVTVGLDSAGRVIISTRESAVKVVNLRRDPYASLAVFPDQFYGEWVQVEGPVEVVELPEALELLVDYYQRVSGEHPDWAEYRAAMVEQHRVLVRMSIERVGPNVSG